MNAHNEDSTEERPENGIDKPNNTETEENTKRKLSEERQIFAENSKVCKRLKSEKLMDSGGSGIVSVKLEPTSENSGNPVASTSKNIPVVIKTEPVENHDGSLVVESSVSIKKEQTSKVSCQTNAHCSSSHSAIAENSVSSTTLRPSCRFGIKCYRRNPAHRNNEAHPGDSDYRRPSFPTPPLGTPTCPFGNSCYRRNPIHFQQYSHPSDFNSAQNIKKRLRKQRTMAQTPNGQVDEYSDLESDEEDPFYDQNGSDSDYRPGADIDEDGEDEECGFNIEGQNCDDFD